MMVQLSRICEAAKEFQVIALREVCANVNDSVLKSAIYLHILFYLIIILLQNCNNIVTN